jgi:putative methyltransferase (TIGR04325 family)
MSSSVQKDTAVSVWKDIYPTWNDACEAVKAGRGRGLKGEAWLGRISQQLSDYRDEVRRHGIAMPPRPSNLPLVCAMTSPRTIVDFGGSSGWCWEYLQNALPNHGVASYVVIETDEVASHMRTTGSHDPIVQFLSSSESVRGCDLLYGNSVLQYLESNAPFLSLIERARPDFVLLDDLVAIGEDDFFTVQSFRDGGIPYRFLGLQKLLREMRNAGYLERIRLPYASPVLGVTKPLEMSGFPPTKQLRYSLSILFKKLDGQ